MRLNRRSVLAATLATPFIGRAARAETVVKMGALKLIHSISPYFYERFAPVGTRIEVIPFENPADCKNAVATKSIDFGTFGIAAGIFAAVAHEPVVIVGSVCNKGMAVVARKDSEIASIKDLKGKRVAIWPGSTQEVFILERLRMEGMSVRDLTPVRVSFSEMHTALARGDVDAYVGAEPAPGVSVSTGVGKIVEYPYSTPMGSLNMIFATHRETVDTRPELVRMMVDIQRQASTFAMANPDQMIAMTIAKLGQKREALAISVPNVELNWRMTPEMIAETKIYAQQMLEMKQIRALPDFSTFLDPRFSDEVAHRRVRDVADRYRWPLAVAVPLAAVALWWLGTRNSQYGLIPTPVDVSVEMWDLAWGGIYDDAFSGMLLTHLVASASRVYGAFLLAAALALPLGMMIGRMRMVRALLDPALQILRPVPVTAWLPLSMIVFGLGPRSAFFLVALGAFYPILVNTVFGVRSVEPRLFEAAMMLGVRPAAMFAKVVLPAALPGMFTGLRLGLGFAWVVIVVGEMTGVQTGLGAMIMDARQLSRTEIVIAGMVTIGLAGFLSDQAVVLLGRRLLRWSPQHG